MRKYAIACACLFIGCAAGSALPALTAQSFPANPTAPRWEQYCEWAAFPNTRNGLIEFNSVLRARGREGWEYMGTVPGGGGIPCFKRPAAARAELPSATSPVAPPPASDTTSPALPYAAP